MNKKERSDESANRPHYVRAVLEADQKENPMPKKAAETIFQRIISFFNHHLHNSRGDKNGKN